MRSGFTPLFQKQPLISLLGSSALSLTLLVGCSSDGGGGGGGGVIGGGGGTGDPDAFRTAEFNQSTGLEQIGAAEGFARVSGREGGEGVRIAVLDNGVDPDHPDLQGAVDDRISIVPGGPLVDGDHGTPVAGVIAGRRNDSGTHGVAFNSTIVDIQLINDGGLLFPASNINTGILTAAGAPGGIAGGEADIMNLSFGADGQLGTLGAMREAADRNKIMVISAGNIVDENGDGSTDDEVATGRFEDPQFPGQDVVDPDVEGLAIVVGATSLDGDESVFTYRCGVAQEFCLFAPGENIRAPAPGGGSALNSGTSFSAPLVAGAAAVVKAAFPGISNREVVQRLLSTATPVDINDDGVINGVDADIAGQGLLNLDNALNPQGSLSVATGSTVSGTASDLDRSGLALGSGVAFGGSGSRLLERAIAFDADGFPFEVDLVGKTRIQSRDTGLSAFVESAKTATSQQETALGTFSFQLAEDPLERDPYRAAFSDERAFEERDERVIRAGFQSEVSEGVSVFGRLNQSSTVDASLQETIVSEGGGLLQPGAFLAPYDSLAGSQSGGGFRYALSQRTALTLAAFTAGESEEDADASLQKIEFSHRTAGDVELRLGYGWLTEEDRFLGSESQGAFGGDGSGESQYLSLSLVAPVTDRLRLFGAYSSGRTDIGTGTGGSTLFDDWSEVRTEAFGVGLAASDLVEEGDGFTLMVGQPLRVTDGSATVDVPVGRTEDGAVITEKGRVDLSPDAREITTEMAYRFALDDDASSLSTGAFVRLNPDHDPDADPDVGLGVRYQLAF